MVPCRWEDRPQQYDLYVLAFHVAMKEAHGIRYDFGKPGDRHIAIIREPAAEEGADRDELR